MTNTQKVEGVEMDDVSAPLPPEKMTAAAIKKELKVAVGKRLAELKQYARWRGKYRQWVEGC